MDEERTLDLFCYESINAKPPHFSHEPARWFFMYKLENGAPAPFSFDMMVGAVISAVFQKNDDVYLNNVTNLYYSENSRKIIGVSVTRDGVDYINNISENFSTIVEIKKALDDKLNEKRNK